MEAILGVMGVGKIWHTRRTLQARRVRPERTGVSSCRWARVVHSPCRCICGLFVELSVRGPTAENYRGAVHSFIWWADSHDLAIVEDDVIDRALCSFTTNCFFGRDNELCGGPVNSGTDVSGPTIFSHWRAWRPAGSTRPEGCFRKAVPGNGDKRTLCAHELE